MRYVACVLVLCLCACGDGGEPVKTPEASKGAGAASEAPRAAETLESVSAAFAAARATKDDARLLQLSMSLIPTAAELKKVLRAGPDTDAFVAKYDPDALRAQAAGVAKDVLKPKEATQTVVKVHSATTEELAVYDKGTVAYAEFPGGMRRFASDVAAPGRVWQVIEYLEPEKQDGMKFTCFTILDGRVLFVLKPWRAIVDKKEPDAK